MEKVDTPISDWVMDEINNLRSENEKLRKVCEAARDVSDVMSRLVKYIEDESDYEELREVLSNLKKELGV